MLYVYFYPLCWVFFIWKLLSLSSGNFCKFVSLIIAKHPQIPLISLYWCFTFLRDFINFIFHSFYCFSFLLSYLKFLKVVFFCPMNTPCYSILFLFHGYDVLFLRILMIAFLKFLSPFIFLHFFCLIWFLFRGFSQISCHN